jgi:hypothetical protein
MIIIIVIIITIIIIISSSDPDSNIIYGSNPKITITKSKKTWLAPEYMYTDAEICNSRHMFSCKKLSKL